MPFLLCSLVTLSTLSLADHDSDLCFIGNALVTNVEAHIQAWDQQVGNMSQNSSFPCQRIVEASYVYRDQIFEELSWLKGNFSVEDQLYASDPAGSSAIVLSTVGQVANRLAAYAHLTSHLTVARQDCLTDHFRLLGAVSVRHQMTLEELNIIALWYTYQGTFSELMNTAKVLLEQATSIFEADMLTLQSLIQRTDPNEFEANNIYSELEADGTFPTLELLRQQTFKEDQLDIPFLNFVLKIVGSDLTSKNLPSLADFGAGNGAYAQFWNQTGRLIAYAFDGASEVHLVTKEVVSFANFGKYVDLWRTFQWVVCFRVLEFVPRDLHGIFIRNIETHAELGVILSYPVDAPFSLPELLENTDLSIEASRLNDTEDIYVNGLKSRVYVLGRNKALVPRYFVQEESVYDVEEEEESGTD